MFLLPHSVGGYTLQRKLGTGGVAESYVGVHEASGGRRVVVRRVLPFVQRDPARLASIEARVRDLLGVRHPFLVQVLDYIVEGEEHFLVEEYVGGVTLEQVLTWCRQSGHQLPHNVFLNIATQICNGLEALHGRSGKGSSAEHVLHLSLKPGSIFLTPEGKVLVGGYGLTRSPTTYPQGGVATPVPARMEYLSPEQTHPDQKLGPSSDIFALGALLYEVLTFESLFRADSNLQTIHKVRRAEVTTPLLRVKERMPGLDKVLFRALALNPRHRYQRAFVLREDLRGLMAGYSFATIGEDTRAFLAPILSAAAEPPTTGYVVGLDDAPAAPADADNFADTPDTRIDADPLGTAAHAASALAERVAREREALAAPETTERTDVQPEAELTPLPTFRLPPPPTPTAAPTWVPDQVPSAPPFAEREAPPAPPPGHEPATRLGTLLPAVEPDGGMEDAPTLRPEPPIVVESPAARVAPAPPAPAPAPEEEAEPTSEPARLRRQKKKAAAKAEAEARVAAESAAAQAVPTRSGPTLAPAPSPFAPPPSRDAALPAMQPSPTLAPEAEPAGGGTVALPAPAPVHPAPLPPAEPVAAPPPPPPRERPMRAEPPPPLADESAFDPPPPARGGVFFTSALLAVGAILLCAGGGYYAWSTWSTMQPPEGVAVATGQPAPAMPLPDKPAADAKVATPEAPVVAPSEDPGAVLAELAPLAEPPAAEPVVPEPVKPAPAPEPAAKVEPKPVAKVEPKPAPKPEPKPVAKVEPKPAPKPVAKVEPKPAPKPEPKPVAKVEPKPAPKPEPKPVAKVEPRPTAKTTAPVAEPLPEVTEPPRPSLDIYVDAAKKGRLSSTDVAVLHQTTTTDPDYTRARSLLLVDAQKRGDEAKAHAYLDELMVLPENQYNPVFLTDYARWHVNRGEFDRALEKAQKAERYWARLPSELVYTKKAEIYEIQAASLQGQFYKSGEDLELLERAVRGWEKYKAHVATHDRADLVSKADAAITRLSDIRARLQ